MFKGFASQNRKETLFRTIFSLSMLILTYITDKVEYFIKLRIYGIFLILIEIRGINPKMKDLPYKQTWEGRDVRLVPLEDDVILQEMLKMFSRFKIQWERDVLVAASLHF